MRSRLPTTTDDVPTLIIVDSHIGYGAPHKQDTSAAHGEPLGEEEIRLAKRSYGWPEDAKFLVPDGVYEHFQDGDRPARPRAARGLGRAVRSATEAKHPDLADAARADAEPRAARRLGPGLPDFPADAKGIATRDSSGKVLNAIAAHSRG